MFTLISLLIFIILTGIILSNSSHLLLCLVLIEIFTFLALWSLFSIPSSYLLPYSMLVFSLFVLESVLGIMSLLNFINFFGSDFYNSSVLSY